MPSIREKSPAKGGRVSPQPVQVGPRSSSIQYPRPLSREDERTRYGKRRLRFSVDRPQREKDRRYSSTEVDPADLTSSSGRGERRVGLADGGQRADHGRRRPARADAGQVRRRVRGDASQKYAKRPLHSPFPPPTPRSPIPCSANRTLESPFAEEWRGDLLAQANRAMRRSL